MNFEEYLRGGNIAHGRLAETIAQILEVVLSRVPDLRVQQIQHRPKGVESLKRKLANRCVPDGNDITGIKDLAGCRIICYTNADVRRLLSSSAIHDNFEVDWDRTKFHYPMEEPTASDLFISYNYVVKLKDDRLALPEYSDFVEMWCEVQVQTTLDHAWSEMAHDTIYRRPPSGFGSAVGKDIEARMIRIMQEYLRPAGFDFQKIANDVQRLRKGRALYEADPLKTISACVDNNQRYHALREFKDHVLPYYDDVGSIAPALRECMMSAAVAARTTAVTPMEHGFDGYTREDILELALDVIDSLRFRHEGAVEATLDALRELLSGAEAPEETKRLIESVKRLSQNNLSAWKQVGPLVQQILVEKVDGLTAEEKEASRPLVLAVLNEVLKFDVMGTTWDVSSVTIHQGAVLASATLRDIRHRAIGMLQGLFRSAGDDSKRRAIIHAFNDAMRPPAHGNNSTDLISMMLQNCAAIVTFYQESSGQLSFELRQTIEHDLLWLYRHRRALPPDLEVIPAVVQARDALISAILNLRDYLNRDKSFVIYKTLVGFESVFEPMWDASSARSI
jgi:ppGpp synthetase/RelA/SpoT-type nucleotidyltranferase